MKKTDKKSQKQQQQLGEFDASAFVRQPVAVQAATSTTSVIAAEAVQADASISDRRSMQQVAEVWTAEHARVDTEGDVFEDSTDIRYPPQIQERVSKHVRYQDAVAAALQALQPDEEAPAVDSKKKPDKDKKAKPVAVGIKERDYDDTGKLLPRMFVALDEVTPPVEPPSEPSPPPPQLFESRIIREFQGSSDPLEDVYRVVEAVWRTRPTQAINNSEQFLWQAIYPQDEDGRPVYNPSGKYHVKLFFWGSWRVVTVDDRVAVDEGGNVLLCQSTEQREMWPTILAKAVYKLMHEAGYSELPFFAEALPANTGHITALATHMLAGWLPAFSETDGSCNDDLDLIRALARAAVPIIPAPLIPACEIPTPPVNEPASSPSRTRKGREQVAAELAWERENFVHLVNARERRVRHLQNIVSTPRKRACQLTWQDSEGDKIRTRAVLAASVEQSSEDGPWDILLLLEYSQADVIEFEGFTNNEEPQAGDNSGAPLVATPIHAVWMRASDMRAHRGVLLRYYVGDDVACSAMYNRNYERAQSLSTEATDDPKDKSKKKSARTPRVEGYLPLGRQPPTFATIQLGKDSPTADIASAVIPPKFEPASSWTQIASVVNDEAQLQAREIFIFAISGTLQPEPGHDGSSLKHELNATMQQVWFDGEVEKKRLGIAPLRIQETGLPVVSGFIHLPATCSNSSSSSSSSSSIEANGLILRIRTLSKFELHMQLCAPTPIHIGDAAATWRMQNGKSFTATGEVGAISCGVQQPFLRLRLAPPIAPTSSKGLYSVLHIPSETARQHVVAGISFPDGTFQPLAPLDLAYIPPKWWNHEVDEQQAESTCDQRSLTLVAWAYCPDKMISPFAWSLTTLLPTEISDAEELQQLGALLPPLHASVSRYAGSYRPNKDLRVFKDVLTLPASAFPVALKLSVSSAHLTRIKLKISSTTTGEVVCAVNEQDIVQIPALYGTGAAEQDELLLEATLDEEHMEVPDAWISNYPYTFSASELSDGPSDTFRWQLDLSTVDGSAVMLRHDYSDEKRLHELKASWEAEDPGRSQRAQAALQLLHSRHQGTSTPTPNHLLPDYLGEFPAGAVGQQQQTPEVAAFEEMVKTRAEMNGEELSIEKLREQKRACLSSYELEVKLEAEAAFFTLEHKNMDREDRAATYRKSQLEATQRVEEFQSDNHETLRRAELWREQMHETHEQHLKEFEQANELRTQYNDYVRGKNEALAFLYQAANDAAAALVKQQQKDSKKKK